MIHSSFSINVENISLDDIMVQTSLYKDEREQAIQQFDLEEENECVSRTLPNLDYLQSDEKSIGEHIQEKQSKIDTWKSRFHEVKEACDQRGISLNASRECVLGVKLADIMDTRTSDCTLVDDLDDKLEAIEERDLYENEQGASRMQKGLESFEKSASDDHLNLLEHNDLMQRQWLISQQTDQALLNAEQQCQALGLLSREISSLNQEAQNLQNAVTCSSQNINLLERTVASDCEQLEDLQDMYDLEDRFEVLYEDISWVKSQQHELEEKLLKMKWVGERTQQDEEVGRAELNRMAEPAVLDSLKKKLIGVTSSIGTMAQGVIHGTFTTFQETVDLIPSFQDTRESISTFQRQVKELPSLIKDAIKESIREASAFLWGNFTNLGWNTIEAISNIGRTILQCRQVTYSDVARNVSVVFDRMNLPFIASSILSGCTYVMTRTPFGFGATAVAGYLFIRRGL